MFGLGPTELVIILAVLLIIFGPSRLPQLGKSIGNGLKEFKTAATDVEKAVSLEEEKEEE